MVSVVVIEFSGMRCQPLRRALGEQLSNEAISGRQKSSFWSRNKAESTQKS
ncbi:iron transporter [Vibrio cholerae]|nr:iron transporter [Vibrio cholerae]